MGADSICIKDMAGLLLPYKATELVKALKETVKIPIQLHTHYTSGVASMTYLKAVEAGVRCHRLLQCLRLHWVLPSRQLRLWLRPSRVLRMIPVCDQKLLAEIADYFRPMRDEALESGLLNPKVPWCKHQDTAVSGTGRYAFQPDFPAEGTGTQKTSTTRYWKRFRVYVKTSVSRPLVTPSSQIVGTQAVIERYRWASVTKWLPKRPRDVLLRKVWYRL